LERPTDSQRHCPLDCSSTVDSLLQLACPRARGPRFLSACSPCSDARANYTARRNASTGSCSGAASRDTRMLHVCACPRAPDGSLQVAPARTGPCACNHWWLVGWNGLARHTQSARCASGATDACLASPRAAAHAAAALPWRFRGHGPGPSRTAGRESGGTE